MCGLGKAERILHKKHKNKREKNENKKDESSETRRNLHTHTHTGSFCQVKNLISLIIATIFITQNVIGATINLEWYNGDSLVKTNSCTVGGTIGTLPTTTPTKKGYTFNGWKTCVSIIKNLDVATKGTGYGYYNYDEYNSNLTKYGITEKGDWATEFGYGTIYGEVSCNATIGTYAVKTDAKYTKNTSTPSGDERWCWCRITGFTANPNPGEDYDYSNGAQCKVSSSAWVFRDDYDSADLCAGDCAFNCVDYVRRNSGFRGALFGAVGE